MMTRVALRARAKVNLYLWVRARREDGYHDVESLLASLDLADSLTIERRRARGVSLSCLPELPVKEEQNLVVRAAEAFLLVAGENEARGGVEIRLEKRIPIGAGLGGGSADAAATLLGMNALHGEPLSQEQIRTMAARLGADVPFCLDGALARSTGIGDRLSPLGIAFDAPLLLVVPPQQVATAWAYARLSERGLATPRFDLASAVDALALGGPLAMGERAFNSFEPVVDEAYGFVGPIKDALASEGAAWSLLTGSGACVFGVFADRERRDRAATALASRSEGWRVIAATPRPCGATIEERG